MTNDTKRKLKLALTTAMLVGATAVGGTVTLPNTFTPNTPARAAEVNANFSSVKTAVDDNHSRIASIEASLAPVQTNVSGLQASVASLNSSVASTWKLSGNTGINPSSNYLGTADNVPFDLRVNAATVARFAPGQVALNTTTPPAGVELTVQGSPAGDYANIYLRPASSGAGYLFSTGDVANRAVPEGWFYIDSYNPGGHQYRRLAITDRGYLGVNRSDTFIAGVGNMALVVGTDSTNGNGAYLSSGGTWTNGSSRQFKRAFQSVNTAAILQKVIALPISTWEYKESTEGRHLGPMAEDFAATFELGKDERRIATVDESGVALAAIQGLNEKLERENTALRVAISALERRLAKLER